jgi:hypothetical protein
MSSWYETPHPGVAGGGAEILMRREVHLHRARCPAAHVVVGRRNDLAHATAGVGQGREVHEVNRHDLDAGGFQSVELLTVASHGTYRHTGGRQFLHDDAAKLSGRTGYQHTGFGH